MEIAYLFKMNPRTVREEWDLVDIYEMLTLHKAKQMARGQIAKENKCSTADVMTPAFCPVIKDGN